jgi:hypothetical protein
MKKTISKRAPRQGVSCSRGAKESSLSAAKEPASNHNSRIIRIWQGKNSGMGAQQSVGGGKKQRGELGDGFETAVQDFFSLTQCCETRSLSSVDIGPISTGRQMPGGSSRPYSVMWCHRCCGSGEIFPSSTQSTVAFAPHALCHDDDFGEVDL